MPDDGSPPIQAIIPVAASRRPRGQPLTTRMPSGRMAPTIAGMPTSPRAPAPCRRAASRQADILIAPGRLRHGEGYPENIYLHIRLTSPHTRATFRSDDGRMPVCIS